MIKFNYYEKRARYDARQDWLNDANTYELPKYIPRIIEKKKEPSLLVRYLP